MPTRSFTRLRICLPNQLESSDCHAGKRLTNCMLFSRWMWLLSHGDVTFQQEAQDEMLSEDFVPPGCMAVLSAELLTQATLHFNLSTSAQYWDLVLAPATDRVTLQGLATAHTSIKMWQAYYSSVHTHLGYFVTDCPIFILLLEHVRGPSKFDGSQRKKQKTKNKTKKKGLGHMDQHSQMHKPQSTPIISGVTGATVENHRHPWGQVGGSMAKLSYASPSQIHPQTHSMRF